MSKEKNPAIDSDNALTWPEDTPIISMDVKLRENGRRYDFDMGLLYSILSYAKASPEQKTALKILVTKSTHDLIGWNKKPSHGMYQHREGKLSVATKGRFKHIKPRLINKTFRHELRHYMQKHQLPVAPDEKTLLGGVTSWKYFLHPNPDHAPWENDAKKYARETDEQYIKVTNLPKPSKE